MLNALSLCSIALQVLRSDMRIINIIIIRIIIISLLTGAIVDRRRRRCAMHWKIELVLIHVGACDYLNGLM